MSVPLFGGILDVVTVCVQMVHVHQQIYAIVMTSFMDIYAPNAMPVEKVQIYAQGRVILCGMVLNVVPSVMRMIHAVVMVHVQVLVHVNVQRGTLVRIVRKRAWVHV